MLGCVGRGGNAQAIRDEILNIMHRNHIGEKRGTWMEVPTFTHSAVHCCSSMSLLHQHSPSGQIQQPSHTHTPTHWLHLQTACVQSSLLDCPQTTGTQQTGAVCFIVVMMDACHALLSVLQDWHQKLHNNTTPDDIVICEAFIAFLEGNGDNGAYWRHLTDNGITRERLESFDRAIKVPLACRATLCCARSLLIVCCCFWSDWRDY